MLKRTLFCCLLLTANAQAAAETANPNAYFRRLYRQFERWNIPVLTLGALCTSWAYTRHYRPLIAKLALLIEERKAVLDSLRKIKAHKPLSTLEVNANTKERFRLEQQRIILNKEIHVLSGTRDRWKLAGAIPLTLILVLLKDMIHTYKNPERGKALS